MILTTNFIKWFQGREANIWKDVSYQRKGVGSGLFDEFGFQPHGAKTVDLAVDVVVAIAQPDVFDFGACLDGGRSAFHR